MDFSRLESYLNAEYDDEGYNLLEDLRNFHTRHYMSGRDFKECQYAHIVTHDANGNHGMGDECPEAHLKKAYYDTVIRKTKHDAAPYYAEWVDGEYTQFDDDFMYNIEDEHELQESKTKIWNWERQHGVRFCYVMRYQGHIVAYILVSHVKGDTYTRIMDVLSNEEVPRATNALILWIMAMELNSRHRLFLKKLKIWAVHGAMVTFMERFGFKPVTFVPDKSVTIDGDFWDMAMQGVEMEATWDEVLNISADHIESLLKSESRKEHTGKYAGGYMGTHYGTYDRGFTKEGGGEEKK